MDLQENKIETGFDKILVHFEVIVDWYIMKLKLSLIKLCFI
jgi:hypothetical protein